MRGYTPSSLRELSEILAAEAAPSFVAGGTDWIIRERKHYDRPEALIWLCGIPELQTIEKTAEGLFIGAAVTMTQLEESPLLTGPYRVLAEAAAGVGSTQIRNRATIGGNIANSSAAADTAAPLVCLSAAARVLRGGQLLEIPVAELITGHQKNVLQPKDVITGFVLPVLPEDAVSHYYKFAARQEVAISRFGVAVCLQMKDGRIEAPRVAIGAIGPKAVRMPMMEETLLGAEPSPETARTLGRQLQEYIRATSGRRYKSWAAYGIMEDALAAFR